MTHSLIKLKTGVILVSILWIVASCSSTPVTTEGQPPKKTVAKNSVLEEVTEKDLIKPELMEVTVDPTYAQLMQLLSSLGYEGVGLQFESQDKLNLLIQVFSNPKAAYRNLRLVYTGTQWNYDVKHQSLTVGDGKDVEQVLTFIEKNIKLKPLPMRKPIVKKAPVPSPIPQTVLPPIATPTPIPRPTSTPVPSEIPVTDSVTETPVPSPAIEEKISPFQNDVIGKPSESTLDTNQPIKEE